MKLVKYALLAVMLVSLLYLGAGCTTTSSTVVETTTVTETEMLVE